MSVSITYGKIDGDQSCCGKAAQHKTALDQHYALAFAGGGKRRRDSSDTASDDQYVAGVSDRCVELFGDVHGPYLFAIIDAL